MPDPWQFDKEDKIWLPKSQDEQRDEKFRKILTAICEEHRVGTMVCLYVNYSEPRKGKIMIVGQPSAGWLDAAWQRLRLFASDLISKGKVR